jgi:hypothetical protein
MISASAIAMFMPGAAAQPAGAATESADSLLQQSLQAAAKASSVHFLDHATTGKETEVIQGAVSAPTASESVSGIGPTFTVELVDNLVYVRGDTQALESALSLTSSQAAPLTGKWISVTSTDSAFTVLTGSLTLTSTLNEFTPTGSHIRAENVRKVGGHRVIPIVGVPDPTVSNGHSGSVALFVSASSPHLPLGGSLVLAEGKKQTMREVVVYTNWGANISVTPPTGATPILSVING